MGTGTLAVEDLTGLDFRPGCVAKRCAGRPATLVIVCACGCVLLSCQPCFDFNSRVAGERLASRPDWRIACMICQTEFVWTLSDSFFVSVTAL